MNIKKYEMTFRPLRKPNLQIPFGVRSTGHFIVEKNYSESSSTKHFVQLFWLIEGCCEFYLNKEILTANSEHVFFYFPGAPHQLKIISEYCNYRWLTLDGGLNKTIVGHFGLGQNVCKAGPCPENLFVRLYHEIRDISHFGQRQAAATAFQIISLSCGQKPKPDHNEILIKEALETIKKNYSNTEFDINTLAEIMTVHRSTLSKIFKRKMGINLIDHLISLRVQKAMVLLRENNMTIAEIAEITGYRDPNYLCKAIKKATGVPASIFRKN